MQSQPAAASSSAAPAATGKKKDKTLIKEQTTKAVNALFSYLSSPAAARQSSDKSALFEDDSLISLQFALKRTPENSKTKPFRIPLPHSLYGREGSEVCLLTKDPQKEYAEKLSEEPVDNITKVISVSTLRSDYRQYQQKRDLAAAFDLFLADARILPLLPPLLGKAFFTKKKQPAPVDLTRRGAARELAAARDSTYLFLSGPCILVKVARTSFSREHVVDNILAAVPHIVDKLPRKWRNVQAIFLKTASSIALPLYSSLPALSTKEKTSTAAVAAPATSDGTARPSAEQLASDDSEKEDEDEADQGGDEVAPPPPAQKARSLASGRGRPLSTAKSVATNLTDTSKKRKPSPSGPAPAPATGHEQSKKARVVTVRSSAAKPLPKATCTPAGATGPTATSTAKPARPAVTSQSTPRVKSRK